MEFVEGSSGIYQPIKELFDTPIYERAQQICWHRGSYKAQVVMLTELLRLQQQKQLPSQVTADDMIQLLVEESRNTPRVQRWDFDLDGFDDAETRLLLKLMWAVNTSMKMRDVEFEARRLLNSPEAMAPQFKKPKIISSAQKYSKSLAEQQQEDLLRAREVGWEVVPKVLQGFWLPERTPFNTSSQQLRKVAVSITKAVEDRVEATLPTVSHLVRFSRSIRDAMVLSIQENVRQAYTKDVLSENIKCFAPDLLNTITDAAAKEICKLFTPKPAVVEEDQSAVTSPPPAPAVVSSEFIEGSSGIYKPIKELFDTPIYERAQQICWHRGSYKAQVVMLTELLRLQQQKQLPSQVTADDMIQLLVEESRNTPRVQRWDFDLDGFDDAETRLLLKLMWAVNTSMKMRDVEFEARRLLNSPEASAPQFKKPKIISQAQKYSKSLAEQQQEDLLRAREVGWEVVPKVLQGFWLPERTPFNTSSQQLRKVAVSVTKAVEDRVEATLPTVSHLVRFSRSIRDAMVLSIQENVRQAYTKDVLSENIKCFAPDLLNTITDAAAKEICKLFTPKPAVVVEDQSAVTTPPPAPAVVSSEFIEGSRGIYKPIRVLFGTSIYERALQLCWHISAYKVQIAVVSELLRLQQQNQLPSEVTAEHMIRLLDEESKKTLREKLWEFELEGFDEVDAKPLLQLVWSVNNSMKRRDVEFEARQLLNSPETMAPQFNYRHPRIINTAREYARTLTEQQQEAPRSKLLCPRDIVLEVVPKVLQGFWLPKRTQFSMSSQQLSKVAVGITKAVEDRVAAALPTLSHPVSFSRSVRDVMVLSIQKKVRRAFTKDVLFKHSKCFAPDLLSTITDAAAKKICRLCSELLEESLTTIQADLPQKPTSAVVPPLTPPNEPPANISPDQILCPEPAVSPPPPPPLTPEVIVTKGGLRGSLKSRRKDFYLR